MVTTGAAVNPSEMALPHVRSRVARGRDARAVATLSVAVLSVAAPGVGQVLIGSRAYRDPD